jgi:hypothetical protein
MAVRTMRRVGGRGWVNMGEAGIMDVVKAVEGKYGGVRARL